MVVCIHSWTLRPGSATYIELPKADHELEFYASAENAYAYRDGEADRSKFVGPLLEWFRRVTAAPARR